MGKTSKKIARLRASEPEPVVDPGPEASPFTLLLEQGAEILRKLRELEGRGRLTGTQFAREAMAAANVDDARVQQIRQIVNEAGGPAARFMSKVVKAYRNSFWPAPPTTHDQIRRMPGAMQAHEAHVAITELKLTIAEVLAAAAVIATEVYPGTFGSIQTSYAEHLAECARIRDELSDLHTKLRTAWAEVDLVQLSISNQDRSGGLVRLGFKIARDLHPGQADWPERLVERVAGDLRVLSLKEVAELEEVDEGEPIASSTIRALEAARTDI